MSTSLEGRVAVVTGGARGLGAGIADHLAQAGARVVIADVIDGAATAAGLQGSGHEFRSLDVTDTAAVERLMASVRADLGSLDILVNNAGISQPIGKMHRHARRGHRPRVRGERPRAHRLQPCCRSDHARAGPRQDHQHVVADRQARLARTGASTRPRSSPSSASPRSWPRSSPRPSRSTRSARAR